MTTRPPGRIAPLVPVGRASVAAFGAVVADGVAAPDAADARARRMSGACRAGTGPAAGGAAAPAMPVAQPHPLARGAKRQPGPASLTLLIQTGA